MAGTNFDTTRVRLGDLVAGGAGVVLFLSLFLNWYNVSVKAVLGSASASVSGWQALSFIDILLFIVAIIAVGVAVARMANAFPRGLPVSPGLLVLGAGILATLLVLFRIIDIPGAGDVPNVPGVDLGRSIGIFIALLASLGVAAGGWMTWNEEGKPRPGGAGTGMPGGSGTPMAAGQPYGGGAQPQATAPPAAAAPGAGAAAAAPPAAAAPAAAAAPSADAPPPGGAADWYPDPRGEKRLRYWDGSQWTHHTAD
jgi:hypothetical protein